MRVGFRVLVALLALTLFVACGGAAKPVEAPAWARTALATGDADFVGAIDVDAMRADPLFGALIRKYARSDEELGALKTATQIDAFANANERGKVATWMVVVHGVHGQPPSRADKAVVFPNAWLLGEGPAFERARQMDPSPEISMPSHALLVSSVHGRALVSKHHEALDQTTEGLKDATIAVLGGSHLEIIGQFRYVDEQSAKHAAALAKLMLAALSKGDWSAKIAAALGKVDFDASGDTVSLKYTLDDDVRDALVTLIETSKP